MSPLLFPLNPAILLAFGIGGVLIVASATGVALRWSVARNAPHPVIDNLITRINAWWGTAAVFGTALLFDRTGLVALFAVASFVALREYATVAPTHRADHRAWLMGFWVVLPAQYYLVWAGRYGAFTTLVPLYAFLALPIVAALSGRHETRGYLPRIAAAQWGLVLCVFAVSHVPALLTLHVPNYEGRNAYLVVWLLLVVEGNDVLQYIWGKVAGVRPLAPHLSPSKTLEGCIGGIASATVLGAALWRVTPFSPLEAALISLVLAAMGTLGGLVLSAIKRDRGIKDWGTCIPGHGGMLDRLDSVCFAAPVFFHIVRWGWSL